jgi:hypothetical protein
MKITKITKITKIAKTNSNLYKYLIYKRKGSKGQLIPVLINNKHLSIWAENDQEAILKSINEYPSLNDLKNYGFFLYSKKTKETKKNPEQENKRNTISKPSHIPDINNPKYYWEKWDEN